MTRVPVEQFREITERYGFNYGPMFFIIKEVWKCDNEGLCLVDISESPAIQTEVGRYIVHPSILDACLQSCFVPLGSLLTDDKSIVPVGFKSITLNDVPSTHQLYCHVVADVMEFGNFDVTLMSPSGKVLLRMSDFQVAVLTSSPRQSSFAELTYEVQWMEEELHGMSTCPSDLTCIVLKESSDFSSKLVTKFQTAEVNVITISPPHSGCFDAETEDTILKVFTDVPVSNSSKLSIINLLPLESSLLPDTFEVIEQAQRLAFNSSVFLLKLLLQEGLTESRLFLVSERTQLLDTCSEPLNVKSIPWGATVWGLRRTANLEESNLRIKTVDLWNKEDQTEVDCLVNEILCDNTDEELAYRDGKRFINRLLRTQIHWENSVINGADSHRKQRLLYPSTIPMSRTLCLRQKSFSKLSHCELAMEVYFCWSPSESLFDMSKPNGCVFVNGIVAGLPDKSEGSFQIGDEVCGVIPSGRVARFTSINTSNVFVKPGILKKEQAAYLPACLSLALFALQRAVSGAEGQKLLIHQANSGPGPAAVVLADALSHQVFCTMSDTCKTSTATFLLQLGAKSVQRQNSFALDSDQNELLDAILFFHPPFPNSLQKSGRFLKKGGRVIIFSSEFDGDVVFSANKNVKYERHDIADVLQAPVTFHRLTLASLEILTTKGRIEQLQGMQLQSSDLVASLRDVNNSYDDESSRKTDLKESLDLDISYRVQSLATLQDETNLEDIPLLPVGLDECGLKDNRTYLVAGGMGGFGLEVARWMAESGAKTIGLLGRSKATEAKRQELQGIEMRTGAKIYTFQVFSVYEVT